MADNNELQEFLDRTGLAHLWSRLKQMLAGKEESGAAAEVQNKLDSHTGNTSNPHGVTKTQVGLGNVDNTSDANKPVSTAQATAIADAKKAGTDAQANLTSHNTNTAAHNDLRLELKALSDRINAVLDSDDTTLDELSEIVAYIKSNKALIDAITTSKVNVTDIVNDLITNVANKPLSAAQGVALKKLIDDLAAEATQSAAGLQSAADKKKLDGIEEGANKTTVDDAMSETSTNPVQNKVINSALTALRTALESAFLSITGGTLKGALELKPFDNGFSKLFKNHSGTADYGTVLQDVDKNGNAIKIILQAVDGSFYFVDTAGNIHRVYGDHFLPTGLGTLTTDVNIKKADVAYASTFGQGTNNVLMRIHNTAGDESNKRTLALFDSEYRSEVCYALRLYDVVNGVESIYDIYGEHNPSAGSSYQDPGTSLLRNSKLVSAETNPTVNGEICWTYK